MAARFWIGGAGNWNDTAHWSTSSGGGGGSAVPTSSDDVTIDSGSGFGAAAAISATSAQSANSITINAASATLLLQNTNTVVGAVTLTAGTLNTNGQTCSWGSFSSSNTNTRTLTLGASSITCTGGSNWNASDTTNLTVTANTATVTMSHSTAGFASNAKNWNGLSIVLSGGGAVNMSVTGAVTLANLTVTGTADKTSSVSFNNLVTCTGTITLGGNSTQGVNRLLVQSNTVDTQRTITAAAYVITGDVDFMDINLAYSGGASWTNAGSAYIGDCGGNSGAVTTNATVSATQTATGTASFTWSTHGWTSRVPLPQDDVSIPNAFVAGRTVTVDMPRLGRTITSTCSGSPTLSLSVAVTIFGGLDMTGIGSMSGNFPTIFAGRSSYTLTSASVQFSGGIQLTAPGGTLTLGDNLSTNVKVLTVNNGTFAAGSRSVSIASLSTNNSNTRSVTGSGTWSLTNTGTSTVWDIATATGMTLSLASATLQITATDSGVTKTFVGGGLTYGTLRHTATGSAGLTITGSNTFTTLDLECTTARTITLDASGTNTVSGGTCILQGVAGQNLSVVSSSPGTSTTLALGNSSYTNNFTSLSSDVIVTGGITTTGGVIVLTELSRGLARRALGLKAAVR